MPTDDKSKYTETFTIDEGVVSISMPVGISAESLEDFKRHLEILTSRIERRVKKLEASSSFRPPIPSGSTPTTKG